MNVWYLHGLESKQGGPKVDFLKEVADEVFAPEMDYSRVDLFPELVKKAQAERPDLIIGSSMGGYYADAIGSHTGIEVLLFNPALHSRSIEKILKYGEENWKRHFVVGEDDDVINPQMTEVLVDISESFEVVKGMGHRTPLKVFKAIYSKLFANEIK